MARQSSIKSHPARDHIERALAEGISGAEIARRYGVSESAISRYRISRMDALTQIIDSDSIPPDDVLARLVDLADSARRTRQLADAGGSPAIRARASSAELAVLDRLADRAGVTDLSAVRLAQSTGALVRAVLTYVMSHPDAAPDILCIMGEYAELVDLRDALKKKMNDR